MRAALLSCCLLAACRASPDATATTTTADETLPRALRPMRAESLEHNNGERDSDLTAVEVDLALHFAERRIDGRVTNHITALVDGTHHIHFHARNLAIESVHDSRSRTLAYEIAPPWIEIELAEPLQRGATEALTIAYGAEPDRGLYFVETADGANSTAPEIWSQNEPEDLRSWVPTWDYPSDRARFEAHFRVDQDMVALSNGVLVDVQDHGGGEHTYHWKLDQEIPTYLFAVAAGRFEHYADQWRGLPIDYYVAPGTGEVKARRAFGETPRMLEYFSELLAEPFPYPKYAQVAVSDFVMGGMENASLTLQNDAIIADENEALDLDGEPRLLVAHELAHQWFGDLVTCFGWSNLWLNEGWASYMELLYQGHVEGRENMRVWLELYREIYLASGTSTRLPLSETWRAQASPSLCNHEYEKGPWVLYMIHRALGDELFWQGVHDYLERHKNGLVTSADFARSLFDSTGRNVYGLIQQWVEGAGQPHYRVTFEADASVSGAARVRVRVRQTQALDNLIPLFDMPVTIALWGRRGVLRQEFRVGQQDETFEIAFADELEDVVFDDECGILCELEVEKDVNMWAHQSRIGDNSAARWRALDGLRGIASAASSEDPRDDIASARLGDAAKPGTESEAARAALIERLQKDDQAMVRAKAARVCTFPEARSALLGALTKDADAEVRLACAHSLRNFELTRPDIALATADLERERSPAVRVQLSRLLGVIDEPKMRSK